MRQLPVPDTALQPSSSLGTIARKLGKILLLPGLRRSWSTHVHLEQVPANHDELAHWLSSKRDGPPIDVTLGDRLVLIKSHTLPRKARKQAQKILSLRAEALGKSSNNALMSVSNLELRGTLEDTYAQYLVRTDDIKRLEVALEKARIPLRSVSFQTPKGQVTLVNNQATTDRAVRFWWLAFLFGVVGICAASLFWQQQGIWQQEAAVVSARTELAEIQADLDGIISVSDATDGTMAELNEMLVQMEHGQSFVITLAKLSAALSDGVWVSELTLQQSGELRVSGIAQGDVIDVIANLESQNWTDQVALARPVRTDNLTGQSNFDLQIRLRRDTIE